MNSDGKAIHLGSVQTFPGALEQILALFQDVASIPTSSKRQFLRIKLTFHAPRVFITHDCGEECLEWRLEQMKLPSTDLNEQKVI